MNFFACRRFAMLAGLGAVSVGCGDDGGATGGGNGPTGTAQDTGGSADTMPPADSSTTAVTDPDPDPDASDSTPTTNSPPECGNGEIEGVEACDDANEINGDGCDNDCTITFNTSVWERTDAGAAGVQDAGQGVALTAEGDVVVVGYIVDTATNTDIYVSKISGAGAEVWTSTSDLSMGLQDRAYAVAVDGLGRIAVIGDTDVAAASSDIWVAVLDGEGTELWSTTFDGPVGANDGGRAIAFDADGNVGVAGFIRAGANDNDIWVAMLDAAGATLWTDTIAGDMGLDDRGRGVVFDDAGALYVAGFVGNGSFNRDVWLRKYEADGTEAWTVTWDSDASADDAGFAVTRSPNGNIIVAGISPVVADNQDFWVGAFEPEAGALQWWKRFGGPAIENDNAFGIAADSLDNVVVVGFKGQSETDADIWMRKLDSTGLELWSQTIFGKGMDRDEARAVVIDANDDIVVTGEIRNAQSNDGDIWVGKFNGR